MSESSRTIFVSYAHEDIELCAGLRHELKAKGIYTWTDEDLRTGERFNESIARSIYESPAVVVISTGKSQRSEYITQEIGWALDLGKTVCEVSVSGNSREELKDRQYVEFDIMATADEAWRDVVNTILPDLKRAIGPSEIFIAHELADIPTYCWGCGHPVTVGVVFCNECGTPLVDESAMPDEIEKDFVDWVVAELQDRGLDCWYEQGRNFVGQPRERLIDDAIDRAGVNLAIVSDAAVRSERFCRQIMRALDQDDDVVWVLHQTSGTSESDVKESWRHSMRSLAGDEPHGTEILGKFEKVVQSDPARFTDKDQREMTNLAATLREKQDHYRTDPEHDRRNREMMKDFIAAAEKRNLDPAQVLNLPNPAAYSSETRTPDDRPTAGPTPSGAPGPLPFENDRT